MVMEAMRLSLLEHEEQQRKEDEQKKKEEMAKGTAQGVEGSSSSANGSSSMSSRNELPPIPSVSTPVNISVPDRSSEGSPSYSRYMISASPNPGESQMDFSSRRAQTPVQPSPLGAISALAAASLTVGSVGSPSHARSSSSGSNGRSVSPSARRFDDLPAPPPPSATSKPSAPTPRQENENDQIFIDRDPPEGTSGPSSVPLVISTTNVGQQPLKSPMRISMPRMDTVMSECGTDEVYDNLPSSPNSMISHQPLLVETPGSETGDDNHQSSIPSASP